MVMGLGSIWQTSNKWRSRSWMLLTFSLLFPQVALLQTKSPDVKEEAPETGSRIARLIGKSSERFPANAKWSELSAESQAEFRTQYENMPDTDEPPYPINGTAPIFQQVSLEAGRAHVYGDFVIDVTVNSKGKATKVTFVKYPSLEAAKVVAYVLVHTTYKPAVCSGKPCIMDFPFAVRLVSQ